MERRPDSLIFRLATLAGLGDTYSRIRLDLVLNLLVVRARLVGELQVFGGDQYRPLLHVRDVATATVPHLVQTREGSTTWGPRTSPSCNWRSGWSSVSAGDIVIVDVPFQDTRNYRVSDPARRE